ncbi:MAG: EF-hand domain-containing protein [Verrucomicrobiota bacterium]
MRRKIIKVASCAILAGTAALLSSSCTSAMKKADLNKDDKISTEELNKALVSAIFDAADKNGNGSVTYDEWKLVFPKVTKKRFNTHALGKNGNFTLPEALAYCEKEGTFDKLVNKIDLNKDGIIDKEEAANFQQKMQAAEGNNDIQKLKTLAN